MSNVILDIIASINTKVKRIQQRNSRLLTENAELRETVFKHLQTIDSLKKQLAEKDELAVANTVAQSQNVEAKKIKSTIDSYIKIIDNTIATLKQK